MCTHRHRHSYKLAAPKILFFLPAFVTRLLTPRSRNSGCGLLLGCRSGLDGGHEKLTFFWRCSKKIIGQKPGNSSSDGRAWHRNRSGVVELVGREPLMFAKVENGVTKSCQNLRRKKRKNNFGLKFSNFSAQDRLLFARVEIGLTECPTEIAKKKKFVIFVSETFF